MGEKRKFILTIIIGLAGLWFVITNFCLPIVRDNAKRSAQYRQLKKEVKAIEGLSKDRLDAWHRMVSGAISNLEKKFLGEGKVRLAEQLTRLPADSNIAFTDITQKETEERKEYQVFPVDIVLRAQFHDLIKYLAAIESNPLMIGVNSMQLRKLTPEEETLDIKVTFFGFRLVRTSEPPSEYLKEKYGLFDEQYFKKLLEPAESVRSLRVDTISELHNPFVFGSVAPRVKKTGETETLYGFSLQGTLWVGNKKAALINGTIVREGEGIGGMEVLEIHEGRVVLMRSGKTYILKMGVEDEFIKP